MNRRQYDYESILERLKESVLRKLGESATLLLFSTNSAILEAVAEEMADQAMYDEFLTREAVWETAMNTSSIMKQVLFYGYRPHRKIGAVGTLRVSSDPYFSAPYSKNISLPQFTQFSGGGLTFLSTADIVLRANANYVEVDVVQGELVTVSKTITEAEYPDRKYLSFVIEDDSFENSNYTLQVNDVEWTEYDSIREVGEGVEAYTTATLEDFSGVEFGFGNGIFGKLLEYGDIVTVTYVRTAGSEGNIFSSGVVDTVDSDIVDENGDAVTLYCTNLDSIAGGSDYEDLDSIKESAPLSFQTGNRAISSSDYVVIIESLGLADKIQVWGEKEINEDEGNAPGTYVEPNENLVYITGITIDPVTGEGVTLTSGIQSAIRTALNDKKGTTDILQFVDTQIVYVSFKTDAYISNLDYTGDQVATNIFNALSEEYSLAKAEYKDSLYFSDYYALIDGAEGVDHHRTTVSLSEMYKFTSAYLFTANLNLDSIKAGSIKIMVRHQDEESFHQVAHDDSMGAFVGDLIDPDDESQGYYELSSDSISYTNGGIGDILITYGLTQNYSEYTIRIDFELDSVTEGDIELKYRQQLLAFYDSDTAAHYMY